MRLRASAIVPVLLGAALWAGAAAADSSGVAQPGRVAFTLASGKDTAAMMGPDGGLALGAIEARAFPAENMTFGGMFGSDVPMFTSASALAGFGTFDQAVVGLAEDLRFSIDRTRFQAPGDLLGERDAPDSLATTARLSWDFTEWGGLDLAATHTREEHGLLGIATSAATGDSAETISLGVSARVGFEDGWVTTVSYTEGFAQLDLKQTGMTGAAPEAVQVRSYGVAIAKHGLFGDDALGLAVSRPLYVVDGVSDLAVRPAGSLLLGVDPAATPSLLTGAPEADIELGYVTTFMDGALALQANAGYQVNVNGQKGADAVSGVARAKINF